MLLMSRKNSVRGGISGEVRAVVQHPAAAAAGWISPAPPKTPGCQGRVGERQRADHSVPEERAREREGESERV